MNSSIFASPRRRRLVASVAGALAAFLGLAVVAGCPNNGGDPNSGDPNSTDPNSDPNDDGVIFPANYRATFTLVRECRNSIEHGSTVRVWVNSVGAAAYQAEANPLPVGTIVVKEEFEGTNCNDDSELKLWSAMKKEAAGFDPVDNDWRWQEVRAPGRTISQNSKAGCISCHRRVECQQRD